MKLTETNKQHAGLAPMMPPELKEYYDSLPPASQNNSRQIVRSVWSWAGRKHPQIAAEIMRQRFGVELCIDYIPGYDDGEQPRGYREENEDIPF